MHSHIAHVIVLFVLFTLMVQQAQAAPVQVTNGVLVIKSSIELQRMPAASEVKIEGIEVLMDSFSLAQLNKVGQPNEDDAYLIHAVAMTDKAPDSTPVHIIQ